MIPPHGAPLEELTLSFKKNVCARLKYNCTNALLQKAKSEYCEWDSGMHEHMVSMEDPKLQCMVAAALNQVCAKFSEFESAVANVKAIYFTENETAMKEAVKQVMEAKKNFYSTVLDLNLIMATLAKTPAQTKVLHSTLTCLTDNL